MATVRKQYRKKGYVYVLQIKVKEKWTGKIKYATKTWVPDYSLSKRKIEKQLKIEVLKFENDVRRIKKESAYSIGGYNISFKDFSYIWLNNIKTRCSKNYYYQSIKFLEKINISLGNYKIRDITPYIIQQYYDYLDNTKRIRKYVSLKSNAKDVLKNKGYGIRYINDVIGIQTTSYIKLAEGKTVGMKWSTKFANELNIPFDDLFDVHEEESTYSHNTIKKYKSIVRAILAYAKKQRLVEDNYATSDYIIFPKKIIKNIEVMSDDDLNDFIDALHKEENIRTKTLLMIFLLTGFRRGEVAALSWNDIDLINNKIMVNKSISYNSVDGLYEKEPKTNKSIRKISVPECLIFQLYIYKKWQDKYLKDNNIINKYNKLFISKSGGLINPSLFETELINLQLKNKLKHYTLHSLRHTNISLQIREGVPITTISYRAGHASVSTTLDMYAYSFDMNEKEAADRLSEVLKIG